MFSAVHDSVIYVEDHLPRSTSVLLTVPLKHAKNSVDGAAYVPATVGDVTHGHHRCLTDCGVVPSASAQD